MRLKLNSIPVIELLIDRVIISNDEVEIRYAILLKGLGQKGTLRLPYRYRVCPAAHWLCVPGRDYGCVHPEHLWVTPGASLGSVVDAAGSAAGPGRAHLEIHHSGQGVQISMTEMHEAWQNGYAERLIWTIKEEEVELSEYADDPDVLRQVGCFLNEVYMHKRFHSALGCLTPAELEDHGKRAQGQLLDIH